MSWVQRFVERAGRTAFERVRRSPAFQEIERQTRLAAPIVTTARLLAGGPADDEPAASRLRARLNENDAEAVEFALQQLQGDRGDFLGDRAYRILYAAANETTVPPIRRRSEYAFRTEQSLARLPLRDAFASLAELAPGLRTLELRVADGGWRADAGEPDVDLVAHLDERLNDVLGSRDTGRSAVLGSVVARVIAQRYLLLISGEQGVLGDLDSPLSGTDDVKI